MTKRLKLTGIGLLAFTSVGFVVASASAQGTGVNTAPTATDSPTTPPPPTTTTPPPPPQPTATPSATTTAEPTAPPNDTSVSPSQAVADTSSEADEIPSLFGSKYTPEKDKASKEQPTATWRWAGSDYFQQIGVTPGTVAPGLTQTPESIVDTFILFQPRFAITKDWSIRVRMTASYEFTDNSYSTSEKSNEFYINDILPSLAYLGIPKFAGIKVAVAAGLGLPVSPVSQARTMIVTPFASVAITKTFEKVAKGEVHFGIIGTASHPLYRDTTAGLENQPQYQPSCFGASDTGCGLQASGAANPENTINVGLTGDGQWGKFSASIYYLLLNTWVYQLGALPGVEPEPGGSVPFRQNSYFNVAIGWDFTNFLTAELGYQMFRTVLTGESTIGNPFYDPNQDMRVYAAATIHLDKLYDTLRGVKEPEKGVVHVQNERRPNPEAL